MKLPFCAAALLAAGCSAILPPAHSVATTAMERREAASPAPYAAANDIPPRYQWDHNYGYCGETSFVSAGLYFGQYASQYDARRVASGGMAQYKRGSQLLIGVNDLSAAAKMHLTAVEWNTKSESSTDAFLLWVKRNVVLGRPVVVGVYTNEYLFYHDTKPSAGDSEYDHIVPVTGIRSNHPLSDGGYYADDRIVFSDNGLWGPPSNPPYVFAYGFNAFQKTREQANAPNGSVYSLANGGKNYGVAITGVIDTAHETLPVRVTTNANYERPEIGKNSTVRPPPMPLVLTITVRHLKPGVTYRLYRYDRFSAIPDAGFNAKASKAAHSWTISIAHGSTYTLTQHIMSDEIAAYRAVPASGP